MKIFLLKPTKTKILRNLILLRFLINHSVKLVARFIPRRKIEVASERRSQLVLRNEFLCGKLVTPVHLER